MARPVSASMIRAVVARWASDGDGSRAIALAGAPSWDGPSSLESEKGPIHVRPCVSVLAAREVLAGSVGGGDGEGGVVVLVTEQPEEELGAEVLARVWRHRVIRPSGWEALQELFRVMEIDPALADARWLADILVEVAPVRGYPPPPSGVLDLETAWRTFLRHALRLEADRPTVGDLLRWGELETSRAILTGRIGAQADAVADRFPGVVGAVARHVFRLVAEGRGGDLVPLGLVCDALWQEGAADDVARTTARIRLEGPLGARGLTAEVARAWGEAAVALVRKADTLGDDATRLRWANRAEAILAGELDALALAHLSDVLPRGFEQRLDQAGGALASAIEAPSSERRGELRRAVARVQAHLRAGGRDDADRVEQLVMAERLVRRVGLPYPSEPEDLESAARLFLGDGAWVDRAREAIGHGETVGALASAYGRLIQRVDAERMERDARFAGLLARWSALEPGDRSPLVPVERVLDRVVVPVARQAPVLFLVLDGWSHPEALKLREDLKRVGWERQLPEEGDPPMVVAALPSVTTVSRASLLSGKRAHGGQEVERQGWAEHPGLGAVSRKKPAILFHRRSLGSVEGHMAPEVRDAILDPEVQVVGVVVNAVDEHLDKGGQLRMADGMLGIRPLRPLLDAAREAGRVLVLASDHGHVLENGSAVRPHGGAGERWRPAHPPAGEGEVEIRGPRVLLEGGSIVVTTTEAIRYIPTRKHGYHGGATPQEMLCPLELFAPPGRKVPGWSPQGGSEPTWWRDWGVEGPIAHSPPVHVTPVTEVEPSGQVRMELDAPSVDREALPAWLRGLLESPLLAAQIAAAGRQALPESDIATLLHVLDASRGVAHARTLAEHLELPVGRVTSKVAVLRRILNVDGYQVITMDGDGTVRFDRGRLVTQFRLDAS